MTKEKHIGYVYVILINSGEHKDEIKIGSTKNPIFRLAQHKKDFKNIGICSVAKCIDYQQCEVDIKKELDCVEMFEFDYKLFHNINEIISKYSVLMLDRDTVEDLISDIRLQKYLK